MVAKERYSDCLARRYGRELDRALMARGSSDASLTTLPTAKCAELAVAYSNLVEERGLLFAALYRRYGPEAGRAASNIISRWVPPLSAGNPRLGLYIVSDCIVDRAPAASREFVRAEGGSEQENLALAKVVAEMPKCLSGEMRITRPLLKGIIAETVSQIDFAASPGYPRF